MGNGYNSELQNLYEKTSFFPMLCRLSVKDVSISTSKDNSSSILDDPSSPKVTCIGQVKKNNRVNNFPSTNYKLNNNSSTNSTPTHHHHQYTNITKLMKLFTSKNLVVTAGNAFASSPCAVIKNGKSSRSCRSSSNGNKEVMVMRRKVTGGEKRVCKNGKSECKNGVLEVNIDKLDPPLPVVKKVQQSGGGDEVNLWQRRRFVAVQSLQIKQIHLPNNDFVNDDAFS